MVYVDKLVKYPKSRYGYSLWAHLWADELGELHDFAELLGLKLRWFQRRPEFPHYDVTRYKRLRALELGAVEANVRTFLGGTNA